jgi:transglutaminase-like putative cysteine protease
MPNRPSRWAPAFVLAALAVPALLAFAAPPAHAAGFPPITDAERALTAVAGKPSAPAVVIFRTGRLELLDYPHDVYSQLDVEVRIKILDDRGREMFGEVEIEHSKYYRLSGFKGRTVLPDGREVPVGEDSIFVDTTSRSRKRYVTKAAFPAVEPGAILDYRYTLRWDSFLTFEPWYFADWVPTLHSEITYVVPGNMAGKPWAKEIGGAKLQAESGRNASGRLVKVWADDVPSVPDEPWSFPFVDLSSRFLLVPTEVATGGNSLPLLRSWPDTCELASYDYRDARKGKGDARRLVKELTAGATAPRARAEAIYRFTRDEIQHDGFVGVFTGAGSTIGRVIEDRRGSSAEQALVLEEMLDAAGLAPRLVWAGDRLDGRIDTSVANPSWFERVLVMVELDGERVFLDPLDRNLGFGELTPGFEGMPALLYHRTKPEVIELPSAPHTANARRAEVTLAIDSEGGAAGTGSMALTGHHAWLERTRLGLEGDREPAEIWSERLGESFPDYEIEGVEVSGNVDGRRLDVTWNLALRADEVLGDEVTIAPSRPIGPATQPFALPEETRLTPVQLLFADVDEVALTVTWPDGWAIEVKPDDVAQRNAAGVAEQKVEVDDAARTLRYSRRLEILRAEIMSGPPYAALREVTAAAEKADAQPLVLSLR